MFTCFLLSYWGVTWVRIASRLSKGYWILPWLDWCLPRSVQAIRGSCEGSKASWSQSCGFHCSVPGNWCLLRAIKCLKWLGCLEVSLPVVRKEAAKLMLPYSKDPSAPSPLLIKALNGPLPEVSAVCSFTGKGAFIIDLKLNPKLVFLKHLAVLESS